MVSVNTYNCHCKFRRDFVGMNRYNLVKFILSFFFTSPSVTSRLPLQMERETLENTMPGSPGYYLKHGKFEGARKKSGGRKIFYYPGFFTGFVGMTESLHYSVIGSLKNRIAF